MAIVQISKIQHRRGVNENLPQLASAELGWSVDTRQLYIGNGTIEEGAPKIGNTEILTEYSDLLSIAQAYTFKGQLAGYIAQTGPSGSAPVARSLQDKLDDFVNVRDFGATGDGNTDDTAAISRALAQIYTVNPNQPLTRRTIYFPAGIYRVTDLILIPTYAKLRGDGRERTAIVQDNTNSPYVAVTTDSLQQYISPGANAAILPQRIDITDMSFVGSTSNHVINLNSVFDCSFTRCAFYGDRYSPTTATPARAAVQVNSNGVLKVENIVFTECLFKGQTYGVLCDVINVDGIVFNNCKFEDLYTAIKIGETTSAPNAFRVYGSHFDRIAGSAIVSNSRNFVSAFNYYRDVGNDLNGTGFPAHPVIVFAQNDCYSLADTFDRTDDDDAVVTRVSTSSPCIVTIPHESIRYSHRRIGPGDFFQIPENTSGNTSIVLSNTRQSATVNYTVQRGNLYRQGKMSISHYGTTMSFDDEYTENGDIGVVLSVTDFSGNAVVRYTINDGVSANLKYSVDWFNF